MIYFLFFLFNFNLLTNYNKDGLAIAKIKIENERNEVVEKAKIVYNLGNKEKAVFTNDKGECEFVIPLGVRLLKVYKEGFYSKGQVENFIEGTNNISIKLSPKVGEIKGIISTNNNILNNIPVALVNEKDELIEVIKSSSQGSFVFYNVPLLRKFYLKVIQENFLPYKSDEIILKERSVYTRNVHLKTNEIILIIELYDKLEQPLSKIFVEVENREKETDNNGIVTFKILPLNKDNIVIRIRDHGIEEKIQITKGKKYLTKKIVIN